MCLGIPMQVVESNEFTARCRRGSEERVLNMLLLGAQPEGTWVLALMDHAREVLTEEQARQIDQALHGIQAAVSGDPDLDRFFGDMELPSVSGPPR